MFSFFYKNKKRKEKEKERGEKRKREEKEKQKKGRRGRRGTSVTDNLPGTRSISSGRLSDMHIMIMGI